MLSTRAFAAALPKENPPKRQTATSQTCAQLFPPVGRAAIGSASWKFCYEIENLMTGVVLSPWLVVTCIWGNARKPFRRWKKVPRCGTPVLSSGFPLTRSSTRYAPTRAFRKYLTALACRNSLFSTTNCDVQISATLSNLVIYFSRHDYAGIVLSSVNSFPP